MNPVLLTVAGNPENQDRGLVIQHGPRVVVCVADGSGGRSGAAEAATMVTEFVRQSASSADSPGACEELLRRMDAAIISDSVAGETTCALAVLTHEEIFGASVGDSGVWLVPDDGAHFNLSRGQQWKPCLGTGAAWPVPFWHRLIKGTLLLATDGLLNYTSTERIVATCREHPPEAAAPRLIELVRYPSGALPDDVTLILVRV